MNPPIIHQGTVIAPRKSEYALIIYPWVQLKRLFESLYRVLVRVMWSELIEGKKKENELVSLLFFLAFCGLSWLSFSFKAAIFPVTVLFFIIWFLDHGIARRAYFRGDYNRPVSLSQTPEGGVHWQCTLSGGRLLQGDFFWEQVREIAIVSRSVTGGAFQDPLDRVWQAKLVLLDHSDWLIEENRDLLTVLNAAKGLQPYTKTPIIFSGSQGGGDYAEAMLGTEINQVFAPGLMPNQLGLKPTNTEGVKCQQSAQKWHIVSRWHFNNHSWQLAKQIFQQSGFLLFVLLTSGFMVKFGGLLHTLFRGGRGDELVVINLSPTLAGLFNLGGGQMLLALGLAIAVMIYRGWQLSRVKHCQLDQHFLRVSVDNQTLGKLQTQQIEAVLVVPNPELQILIVAKNGFILLPKLQQEADTERYATYLGQGLRIFQTYHSNSDS